MSPIFRAVFLSSLFVCTAVFAQSASISVDKAGSPNPVVAGTNITYTITISSEGPDDAQNVVLNDALPAGTTFVSINSIAGWTCTTPAPGATGTVNCTRPAFPPGSDVFTLVLNTSPALTNGSTLSNTATISTTTSDPAPNDNESTADTLVQAASNLGITKNAAPDPAPIGGPVTFTLGYSASGPSDSANTTITDVLPAGILFSSVAASGWSCSTPSVGTNGTVTCSINSLAPGASGTITIGATVDSSVTPGTVITNTATITGDVIDSVNANDSASASVTAQSVSNLAITKNAAPNPVVAGSNLTYTIGFSASGPSPAPNVSVTDLLPGGTTFTSIFAPAGWSCTTPAAGASGTVTCTNPSLASGASGTITIVVTVSPAVASGTTISNTATISGSVIESNSDNASTASVTTSIVSDLGVTKSAPSTIFGGNSISYSIAWSASGPSQASGVAITDALPASTTFASVTAPGFSCTTPAIGANGTVTCTAATIAPGASGTITIAVNVDPAAAPATVISNTATMSSSGGDTNAANNSSTATTTVSAPTITATKSILPAGQINIGQNVTYVIVLHNSAAFTQLDNPGDELVDVLPTSLHLVSATASSGTAVANTGTNTVQWNGAIVAGGNVTITITATVLPGTAGSIVSNQAAIHFDGDNNGTNESTTLSAAPGTGGPTIFIVGATAIPALSPALLLALAALLAMAGWKVMGR